MFSGCIAFKSAPSLNFLSLYFFNFQWISFSVSRVISSQYRTPNSVCSHIFCRFFTSSSPVRRTKFRCSSSQIKNSHYFLPKSFHTKSIHQLLRWFGDSHSRPLRCCVGAFKQPHYGSSVLPSAIFFWQRQEESKYCRRLKFTDIMANTHQRLTKYPLLVREMLKSTSCEFESISGLIKYEYTSCPLHSLVFCSTL